MSKVIEKLEKLGIIPVVKIEDAADAVPLAKALLAGGLPVAEITFRTDAAESAIKNIHDKVPEVLLGAGTVLTVNQVKRAVDAGAEFIVSPGFNPDVVMYCAENGVSITPGVSNPSDIEAALSYGVEVLKFFPAEAFGGLKTLKAMSAPYGKVRFIPTGGINAGNLNEYLAFDKVVACGGSWMVKADLIAAKRFDEIERLTREAVAAMLGFDLAHIGINASNAEESLATAAKFAEIFNMPLKKGNSSNFAGKGVEVNKSVGLGVHGHIAIKTNSLPRSVAYLERMGVEVDMSTAKGPKGKSPIAVYLKEEIGGFAVHLLQV
ncbi:MAG: bifunctional 4-hydroxy-2-oxoglutarate aldolase/2-dehydro-3-deoxy-phosphogluconate aldolase [Victivallales bacterium]|nr:bifunctional 4-hydroxy-2-oxoglutarate aldolase/2-dehydro-3-deoxy-phosphogluconate aldolase [Victivallales bacterium]